MDSKTESSPHAARPLTLSRAIRARRKALRLTQIDLSRLAGAYILKLVPRKMPRIV